MAFRPSVVLTVNPTAETMLEAGNRLLAQRQYDAADAAFRAVLSVAANPSAWAGIGECSTARGSLDEAVSAFETALDLVPDAWSALLSLADTMLWRDGRAGWEQGVDRALTVPIMAPAAFHFLVRKACIHWLNRKVRLCDSIIQALTLALKREGEPLARLLQGYTMSMARNLDGLLASEKAGLTGRYAHDPSLPPVHLVGDSHCIAPSATIVAIGGREHRVRPRYVLGCKAWHYAAPGPNGYKAAVQRIAGTLAASSQVIVSAGDIDCRWRSGLFNLHRKTGADLGRAIATTAAGYLDFVQAAFGPGGHTVSILTPPAPRIDSLPWDRSDQTLVATIIAGFQDELRAAASARGLPLIDLYRLSVGADGWSNRRFHVDTYHLNARALDVALEGVFSAAPRLVKGIA